MLEVQHLLAKTQPSTADAKTRTVDLAFYTGTAVERFDWWTGETYMLAFSMKPSDVKLDRLNNGAPLLNSHNDWNLGNVLGVVRKAWLADETGYATVEFSNRDEVTPIWEDVQAGILQNISMGAVIRNRIEVTPKGSKMKHFLANDWEPLEVSVVPVPADPGAQFLSAFEASPMYARLLASLKSEKGGAAAPQTDEQAQARLNLALALNRRARHSR